MRLKFFSWLGLTALLVIPARAQWVKQSSGTTATLYAVHFINANVGYAAGSGGTLLKTLDGGSNWTAYTLGKSHALRAIGFRGSDTGFIAGWNILLKTTNGGVSWKDTVVTPLLNSIAIVGNLTYAAGCLLNPGLGGAGSSYATASLRSTDGGASWATIGGSLGTTGGGPGNYASVSFLTSNIGLASGIQSTIAVDGTVKALVLKTVDGGQSWYDLATIKSSIYSIKFTSDQRGYIAGSSGIYSSSNGGNTWTLAATASTLYSLSFPDSVTGWAVGENDALTGGIYKTSNAGLTWGYQSSGVSVALRAIHCLNPSQCWAVGEGGTILKTTNGGGPVTPVSIARARSASQGFLIADNSGVHYLLPLSTPVGLKLFDRRGKVLLKMAGMQTPGEHRVDFVKMGLAAGVYFVEFKAGAGQETVRYVQK